MDGLRQDMSYIEIEGLDLLREVGTVLQVLTLLAGFLVPEYYIPTAQER
jgi:hypothetical protein